MFNSTRAFAWILTGVFALLLGTQVEPLVAAGDWPLLACLAPHVIALAVMLRHAWSAQHGAFISLPYDQKARHVWTIWGCIGLVAISYVAADLVQDWRMYD